ncbi:MAG: hypothetical protein ACUVV6_02250 [Thermoplasmatota archaeon]
MREGRPAGAGEGLRFYNFPCPVCGRLVRPWAGPGGRVWCTSCGSEITQAVRGMLRVSWMNRVRRGTLAFAACSRCGGLALARRQDGPEGDELWTCVRCGAPVFV